MAACGLYPSLINDRYITLSDNMTPLATHPRRRYVFLSEHLIDPDAL
jgi:hypothetical protein